MIFLIFLLQMLPGFASQTYVPFRVVNSSPVHLIHGLPYQPSPQLLDDATQRINLSIERLSLYAVNDRAREKLIIDGETNKVALSLGFSFGQQRQIELTLPYFSSSGGSLDGFIDDWHKTFGLPEAGRDLAEKNQLRYYYQKDGRVLIDYSQKTKGIGDIQVSYSWDISGASQLSNHFSTLNLGIKLPTGDSRRFLGSGVLNASIWSATQYQVKFKSIPSTLYYSYGVLLLDKGDILSEQQKSIVGFSSLGLGVKVNPTVELKTQLDGHTPFYNDSELSAIGGYGLQLSLGGSIQLAQKWNIDLNVVEDLSIRASPDVSFYINIRLSI